MENQFMGSVVKMMLLDCQFIEYTLYDVVVSPSLNPVEEVENSKKLVESAKIFVKSKTFDVLFILTILTLFGIISSVYLKVCQFSSIHSRTRSGIESCKRESHH